MSFAAEVRRQGESCVVDMTGDIDRQAEEALDEVMGQVGDARRVVLNFGGVGYINSTGIALIVGLVRRASEEGRSLSAFGLSPHYQEIFEITRLSDFVEIAADEAAATRGG